jgi:hypothetical protein
MSDLYLEEVPLGLQVQELQEGGNIFVNDRPFGRLMMTKFTATPDSDEPVQS